MTHRKVDIKPFAGLQGRFCRNRASKKGPCGPFLAHVLFLRRALYRIVPYRMALQEGEDPGQALILYLLQGL